MGLPNFRAGQIIKASEMNQAFADTVAMSDLSVNEINTGVKWINGKWVYSKTIFIGSLPNNAQTSTPHGIANLEYLVDAEMRWYDSDDQKFYTAPRIDGNDIFICVSGATRSTINYTARGTNWTPRTSECTITMWYTKSNSGHDPIPG